DVIRPLPTINVPRFDGSHNADFWTAISGDMRPAVDLVVSATFDAAVIAEAGAPVFTFTLGAERAREPATRETREGAHAEGIAPRQPWGDSGGAFGGARSAGRLLRCRRGPPRGGDRCLLPAHAPAGRRLREPPRSPRFRRRKLSRRRAPRRRSSRCRPR